MEQDKQDKKIIRELVTKKRNQGKYKKWKVTRGRILEIIENRNKEGGKNTCL